MTTPTGWGFPNFGMATKAHLFKEGREKSACGKHSRSTVIVLSTADVDEYNRHVDCKTCSDRR